MRSSLYRQTEKQVNRQTDRKTDRSNGPLGMHSLGIILSSLCEVFQKKKQIIGWRPLPHLGTATVDKTSNQINRQINRQVDR